MDIHAKLTGEARTEAFKEIPQWSMLENRDALFRKFQFKDFKDAWNWMSLVAIVAEELDHHPEWFNVYNRVEVTLATHTCNGISSLDVIMAKRMDTFFEEYLHTNQQ